MQFCGINRSVHQRSYAGASSSLQNSNPIVYKVARRQDEALDNNSNFQFQDELSHEPFTASEIYDHIKNINDPEHPLTLEQLNVLSIKNILINDDENIVHVNFTPTVMHCSMATLIGLCIRVQLLRTIPSRFKVTIKVCPGSHQSEDAVNKQLNDKERVAAALENVHLIDVVNKCLSNCSN